MLINYFLKQKPGIVLLLGSNTYTANLLVTVSLEDCCEWQGVSFACFPLYFLHTAYNKQVAIYSNIQKQKPDSINRNGFLFLCKNLYTIYKDLCGVRAVVWGCVIEVYAVCVYSKLPASRKV